MQNNGENKEEVSQMMSTHSRYSVGLTYVYPVISRRAGGVSIGINLNTNNACNWHCAYCQVPGLIRGVPEKIDLAKLASELRGFLDEVIHGSFMRDFVPEPYRVLKDIAFSGNGEPTSASEFPRVIALVSEIKAEYEHLAELPVRLITNGSFMGKETVLDAIKNLSAIGGEVWFKVDAISKEDQRRINGVTQPEDGMNKRLAACAARCDTWLQSCFFNWDGLPPSTDALGQYIEFCCQAKKAGVLGVHLYTIARQSMQPEGEHLSPLSEDRMQEIADKIKVLGLAVTISL